MVSTKLPLFRFAMSINVYGFSGARPNSSFSSTLASCDTGLGHCAATQGPTPTCCRAKLMLDEKILIRICYTIICKPRMQQLGNLKRGLCRFQCGTLIPFRDILGSFLQKLDFGLHFFSSLNHWNAIFANISKGSQESWPKSGPRTPQQGFGPKTGSLAQSCQVPLGLWGVVSFDWLFSLGEWIGVIEILRLKLVTIDTICCILWVCIALYWTFFFRLVFFDLFF